MSEEELTKHEWTFCHRVYVKRTLGGKWLDHNAEYHVYSKIPRGATPGTVWNVECSDDGTTARIGSAKFTGRRGTVDPEWAASDRTAVTLRERDLLLARYAKERPLRDMTLAEINETMYRGTITARSALLAAVLSELGY